MGCLTKDSIPRDLIRDVHAGKRSCPPHVEAKLAACQPALTFSEMEVLNFWPGQACFYSMS
jgi:hypothetical protein